MQCKFLEGKGKRTRSSKPGWPHNKLEVKLDYMRPCFKGRKKRKKRANEDSIVG